MRNSDSERESRQVAEASREKEWSSPSFMRELFMGRFRLDLIHPLPGVEAGPRPEFEAFYRRFEEFLRDEVDPAEIDRTGEYPPRVLERLRELGAFGMKIPAEFGGLGLSEDEYTRVMRLLGSVDGNLTALLSAHQSIGVPQPVKLFGTEEQKRRFLPRCAAGAISGFALTEPRVGSDPARLSTSAVRAPDGKGWILDGEKLWCTNGTIAELLVVMARNPDTGRISAFVVETSWPGVVVEHRCRFMGLRALANAHIAFRGVRVPDENLVGAEGEGLKIALVTLNTGRLAIPGAVVGAAKKCLEISRKWAGAREQWGAPIGRHEAIAHKLADMAATTFAMEAVSDLANAMADSGLFDIRLEAAAAKEWNTTQAWRIIDDTLQIRGGRGFETEASLAARGEAPVGVERMLRDSRINTIFEGSSEIMHLFMAREAVDKHLDVAGTLVDPDASTFDVLRALPGIAAFYTTWYPSTLAPFGRRHGFGRFGSLATHLAAVERRTRRLARNLFHGMAAYQGRLQRKQMFLFRAVDIANDLFAMAAAVTRAQRMYEDGDAAAPEALELADVFCRTARRRIDQGFRDLWRNDDSLKVRVAGRVLDGDHAWLEAGAVGLPFSREDLVPPAVAGAEPAPGSAARAAGE